jgi:hypothetical protein
MAVARRLWAGKGQVGFKGQVGLPGWEWLVPATLILAPPVARVLPSYDPLDYRRGPRGRAPSAEARAIVARMAGMGFAATKIARLTGFRPSTLYRVFREELTAAADMRDLEVLESAFHQAVGGVERNFRHADASMTRFWLGHRLGWRQPTAYDQGRNTVAIDLDRLSDEELHELDRIIGHASDEGGGPGGSEAAGE